MSNSVTSNAIPPPRLIVRIGVLGNRFLGHASGIAEDETSMWQAVGTEVEAIFEAVEATLMTLHRNRHNPPAQENLTPVLQRKWLASLFGQANRWGHDSEIKQHPPVFSDDPPMISLLIGDAEGTDQLVRRLTTMKAAARSPVEYQVLGITHDSPDSVATGLGLGTLSSKDPAVESEGNSNNALTRQEAKQRQRLAKSRIYAFRAQSEALRHHSDLLLAVWDPDLKPKAGGTVETVEAAIREQIPVIAVRLKSNYGIDTQLVECLRHFRGLDAADPSGGSGAEWQGNLSNCLKYLLSFPDQRRIAANTTHEAPSAYQPRAAFAAFCADRPLYPIWPGKLWRWFDAASKRIAHRDLLKETDLSVEDRAQVLVSEHKWTKALRLATWRLFLPQAAIPMPAPAVGQNNGSNSHEFWYDQARHRAAGGGMSGLFGDAHRGGIIVSYFLAALAVLLAVVGGILHGNPKTHGLQVVIAFGEVSAIVLMWALHVCSTGDEWNAAYTDTRILAEALRMMRFLAPLGVHTPLPRLPLHLREAREARNPDQLWSVWYFRALVRMAPLRLGLVDLEEARQRIKREALSAQSLYHHLNATRHRLLHHGIEVLMKWLFTIVGIFAGLHLKDLFFNSTEDSSTNLGLIVCVGGPALIAALHGFASQMEFHRLQIRSSSMVRLLKERSASLNDLDLSDPTRVEAVWGLAQEGLETASLLIDETAEWSLIYRNTDIHAG
jgi:hypothetical protein